MLRFLKSLCKQHKITLSSLGGILISTIIGVWNFDLTKITPTGLLAPQEQWQLRWLLTLIIIILVLLPLVFLILSWYKNDIVKLSNQPKRRIIHPGFSLNDQ
jgi:hypothetical protein